MIKKKTETPKDVGSAPEEERLEYSPVAPAVPEPPPTKPKPVELSIEDRVLANENMIDDLNLRFDGVVTAIRTAQAKMQAQDDRAERHTAALELSSRSIARGAPLNPEAAEQREIMRTAAMEKSAEAMELQARSIELLAGSINSFVNLFRAAFVDTAIPRL